MTITVPDLAREIDESISKLSGLILSHSHRAATVQVFHFSQRIEGGRESSGDHQHRYSIHVQCPWRIRNAQGVVVAASDLYFPGGSDPNSCGDFDWESAQSTRLDERLEEFIKRHVSNPLVVQNVKCNAFGDFYIDFQDDCHLEAFNHQSVQGELWRLIALLPTRTHTSVVTPETGCLEVF